MRGVRSSLLPLASCDGMGKIISLELSAEELSAPAEESELLLLTATLVLVLESEVDNTPVLGVSGRFRCDRSVLLDPLPLPIPLLLVLLVKEQAPAPRPVSTPDIGVYHVLLSPCTRLNLDRLSEDISLWPLSGESVILDFMVRLSSILWSSEASMSGRPDTEKADTSGVMGLGSKGP